MPRGTYRFCCVPNCKSGYGSVKKKNKAEGKRNPSLFSFPKNPEYCRKWVTRIKRLDREPNMNDRVCELHFQKEFIVRFYETNMPDGTVHRIKRGTPTLKPDAIPTIFPNCPGYMTTTIKIRKPPKERKPLTTGQNRTPHQTTTSATKHPCEVAPPEIDNLNDTNVPLSVTADELDTTVHSDDVPIMIFDATVPPVPVPTSVADDKLQTKPPCDIAPLEIVPNGSLSFNTFHSFVNDGPIACMLAKLKVPDGWWKVVLQDMCVIMWIDKSDSYNVTKRVLIDLNGNIKVYIGLVKVTVEGYEVLSTAEEVVTLLLLIKPMLVCPGAFDRNSDARYSCRGYHFKGARCIACSTCRTLNARKIAQAKQTTQKEEPRTDALLTEAWLAIERADEVMKGFNKKKDVVGD